MGILASLLAPKVNAETLHLTSLHWPPYASSQLAEQGAVIAITRAAVNAMGHKLEVDFYPWSRAVRLVNRKGAKYDGYLPAYPYPTEKFVFSDVLGTSPLGLVERRIHPVSWLEASDLNQYTLGVVRDYVNTSELDAMIKLGTQKVEVVNSDEHNLTKVATARVDAAVMDVNVLQFLLLQSKLKPLSNKVQVNKHILENKDLTIAFANNSQGLFWRDIVNAGLAKIDSDAMLSAYIKNSEKK
ncbi:substrate-binding periplasmic protein [Shewanella woodyi]|uniref:substrate-binding periplasmic protein n=1 Tax=Shewanella woodyi TaxID=60961 RepID=UPI0007EB65D2|nr:transporter substrate-binding domain-containing protein [Shewanella woodyi]